MTKARVIYVHGFNSSPESFKAKQFGQYLKQKFNDRVEYLVPCLNHEPLAALITLESLINDKTVLIGSSLGGFFATYLSQKFGIKAVLVNPAVMPFNLMTTYLGEQYNPYQDYSYQLEMRHVTQLKQIHIAKLHQPQLVYLLQQTADEVLNYQDAVKYYADGRQTVEFGGDHSFIKFERHFESIANFLEIA
ncbi:esterase YqiA [Pseudoalteromonas sp. C2R02]|uniref:YqiA/YcfP family alpha/beta fold hydrolase n=1 Tax=Pseudoalteromonas sp. C2R02 TaxID=2841565 RepID=UPI001C086565|nr:YqiA/YcfP family alpha/beta fold hydrolase [Pseudoalteromonas sp. C2R02]MBU2971487.1 esterase YqiA [Pseudoalteromonas sp. C2R02]